MQLHPDRVVRVEPRRREPFGLALVDARQRGAQPGTVRGEAIDRATDTRRDGPDPLVERVQAIDHRPVVAPVAVIVGTAPGLYLPVVADAQQLTVQRQEAFVRPLRDALLVPAGGQAGP